VTAAAAPVARRDDAVRARLAARLRASYAELLDGAPDVALLDYPNHVNIGDAAIWAGELAVLRSLGVRVRYACDQRSYVPGHLRAALGPRTVILLHGGGNFGDLYPRHQRLRERVLADFPDRRTVQLPQSVAHAGRETAERLRKLARRHRDLHVLARDLPSQAWFAEQAGIDAALCPDSALAIGDLGGGATGEGVLWLARTDPEALASDLEPPAGVRRGDWPHASPAWNARRLGSRLASAATSAAPGPGRLLWPPATRMYPRLVAERLRTGAAFIGSARVVVTDRLHAHILSLLCGVPSVLCDNSTGKVRACYELWTGDSPLAHWGGTPAAALELAAALAEGERG
jgi:exopolysaccharide biosynthesis predicted pyruvyltransferase EpsI